MALGVSGYLAPVASNGKKRITFQLPRDVGAEERVELYCDFNQWTPTPLTKRKDGRFSTTLTLTTGKSYRFRYLVDGRRWENDWNADEYVPNDFGTDDSVIHVN